MDVITFEFIRDIHRKEKESRGLELQELPENFFVLVQKWLTEKEKLYEATRDPEILLEVENGKKLLKEIINLRQRKIVISALQVARGGTPPENMLPIEEEFFDKILSLLNEYKSLIELEVTGDFVKDKLEEIKENLKELEKKELSGSVSAETIPQQPEEVKSEEKAEEEEEKSLKEEEKKEIEETKKEEEKKAEEKAKEKKEEKKTFGGIKMVKVMALTNIPRFVDENLNAYGPYKSGEVFELPEDLAKILVSRKVVEEVEE
jgi:signal recognition particle GTPase